MRGLILALVMIGTAACCTTYTFTEFNTTGVVTNFRPICSKDGSRIYTVLISKEERAYTQYISPEIFQIGDTVLLNAKMTKLK